MNLLGAKLYDPAAAVSKATSSLLAMTAFDTTNLRLIVTVPAHGMLRVRVCCTITGATTVPTIFLGVMNGATVVGRCNPQDFPGTMNAATQNCPAVADFVVTGLTPGSITLDAAYGVEVVVASTNIKYGGPNNTITNDAWGAFQFEVWDPQPMQTNGQLAIDANGRVDVSKVSGTAQTAQDLGASITVIDDLVDTEVAAIKAKTDQLTFTTANRLDSQVFGIQANAITAAAINADAITDAKVASDVTIASVTGAVGSVTGSVGSVTGAVGSVTGNVGGNVTGSVGSVATGGITTASFAAGAINAAAIATDAIGAAELAADAITEIQSGLSTLTAAGVRSAVGLASANLDTQLTAIDDFLDTEIAAIKAKTDNLPVDPADASDVAGAFSTVNSTLSTLGGYVDTEVAAIKAVTDKLDTAVELDGAVYRFSTNALEQAPTGAGGGGLDAAGIRAAIGLASANLDTQLDALPTNAELATALASADDPTLAAIAALNNISSAQVQTAAAAALTAYDPPTRTEATSDKAEIITEINANETKIDAVKAKTDSLTFTVANKIDANIQSVNGVTVSGTGAENDPWSPA